MASRGKAAPDRLTQQRLFAASAGYCQNPACHAPLFKETGREVIHIAEMAHVFAANDQGPRAPGELTEAERGAFDNLILLCPSCHTEIDKAEQHYPANLVRSWKAAHDDVIRKVFGAAILPVRSDVRKAFEPLLAENRALFDALNPNLPYSENPESEVAAKWQHAMRWRILPNNRRMLALLDANRRHMSADEKQVLEQFRQHVDQLALRHLTDSPPVDQQRFPTAMEIMMVDV